MSCRPPFSRPLNVNTSFASAGNIAVSFVLESGAVAGCIVHSQRRRPSKLSTSINGQTFSPCEVMRCPTARRRKLFFWSCALIAGQVSATPAKNIFDPEGEIELLRLAGLGLLLAVSVLHHFKIHISLSPQKFLCNFGIVPRAVLSVHAVSGPEIEHKNSRCKQF